MKDKLVMYTAEWCGDCQQLKQFLNKHKIDYEMRDIQINKHFREDLMKHAGEVAVPFLIKDGIWVRGYPDGEGYSEEYAKKLFGIK